MWRKRPRKKALAVESRPQVLQSHWIILILPVQIVALPLVVCLMTIITIIITERIMIIIETTNRFDYVNSLYVATRLEKIRLNRIELEQRRTKYKHKNKDKEFQTSMT